jgi:hypothetical protein
MQIITYILYIYNYCIIYYIYIVYNFTNWYKLDVRVEVVYSYLEHADFPSKHCSAIVEYRARPHLVSGHRVDQILSLLKINNTIIQRQILP